MPAGNGKGPRGQGPMTGRGLGNCGGNRNGRGVGRFSGRGNRWGQEDEVIDAPRPLDSEATVELAKEVNRLREHLAVLEARLGNQGPSNTDQS